MKVRGLHAIEKCLQLKFKTVWDIGSGDDLQANEFKKHGKDVITIDFNSKAQIFGAFPNIDGLDDLPKPDLIWSSHCLEHQRNVGDFLDGVFNYLPDGKIFAVTVPNRKDEIVGGHLTIWNAGLLLYNLIVAGFDCRNAMVKTFHKETSVIVKKTPRDMSINLRYGKGDIEMLAPYFPFHAVHGFNGVINSINWD